MTLWTRRLSVTAVLLAGCQPSSRTAEPLRSSAVTPVDTSPVPHSPADARFLRDMIGHHAQALAMTSLVGTRSRREDLRLLARRIDVSQRDEIRQMQRWLRDHRLPVPGGDAAHMHHAAAGHEPMTGMLTAAEMARLSAATGAEFDRLFLEYMIRHHEGALSMVKQLFGTNGAAQAPEVYQLASDVDAEQRAEIARMRGLLATLPSR